MLLNANEKDILSFMPERIQPIVAQVLEQQAALTEIRLRSEKPLVVFCEGQSLFVNSNAHLKLHPENCIIVKKEEIASSFLKLCHYSVYTYQENLNASFITTTAGNRVGIGGNAVIKNGEVTNVKNVTSLNFRLARECKTNAVELLNTLDLKNLRCVLIIGAPGSGKTTLLRGICKELSSGYAGHYAKCCVVDERGEIAASHGGIQKFDVGINTDVLSFFPKAQGILNALRTLSPEYIFADEFGNAAEAKIVLDGLNSGAKFFLSLHAGSIDQALQKPQFRCLQSRHAVDCLVLIGSRTSVGEILEVKRL